MTEWHISSELFERFLRSEASQEETLEVVRHLLGRCPQCLDLSHRAASDIGLRKAGWEEGYEEVFARAFAFAGETEQRIALEKIRGWAQWAELEPLKPQLRFALVESGPRFHTFGFYSRLLEAARWYGHREPAEAVDIARLAIVVAERLDPAEIGEERVADLRAAAWGSLGNAQRIAEDFQASRRAFNEAWRHMEQGTGDPLEGARLISLEASYMKDIGEFELAESSLEEALEIYRKAGDPHQQGRILIQMGEIIAYVHPERGIVHLRKAIPLIDPAREPRLELVAQHALATCLNDTGQPEEALVVLERARPLYEQFEDELSQLRLHWLEGRVAARLGELAEAEAIFEQLWDEFRARSLHQEVVLVTIDLAQVATRKGEPARAAELAGQCYSIMKSWGLHKHALAAWIVFRDALTHGEAMGDFFDRIGKYYRRHWFVPGRFEGGR